MKMRLSNRLTVGIFFILVMLAICWPGFCAEESTDSTASRQKRNKIDYQLVLKQPAPIRALLSSPESLEEKVLTDIETRQKIQIKRSSMVKTEKCLGDLLRTIANLGKMATGNVVTRIEISFTSDTSRASIWSEWSTRKLESPVLSITLYYQDQAVGPTEIVCSGRQYL